MTTVFRLTFPTPDGERVFLLGGDGGLHPVTPPATPATSQGVARPGDAREPFLSLPEGSPPARIPDSPDGPPSPGKPGGSPRPPVGRSGVTNPVPAGDREGLQPAVPGAVGAGVTNRGEPAGESKAASGGAPAATIAQGTGPEPDEEPVEVLVVPASRGLPFAVPLPFGDPVKVRRVLPELLRDVFVGIDAGWRFAWLVQPAGDQWRATGLAFPGSETAAWNLAAERWRLVVPDAFLVPAPSGRAVVRFTAPGSAGLACFDDDGRLGRIALEGRGLPLPLIARGWATAEPVACRLLEEGGAVYGALERLLGEPGGADLAAWREIRRQEGRRAAWQAAIAAVLAGILVFHGVLWWECRRLTRQRQDLTAAMASAYTGVFPRDRAVEPVAQTRRFLRDGARPAGPTAVVPDLPWLEVLDAVVRQASTVTRLDVVAGNGAAWRVRGVADGYARLEALVAGLQTAFPRRRLRIADSQPDTDRSGKASGLRFEVEGTWEP
ncbi:MAG: hypothetical protein GX442_15255 [Candidatus Riflebacteria bacterium]|nr:hypothetical protein [Candidatus Riflebacteria bacterium]